MNKLKKNLKKFFQHYKNNKSSSYIVVIMIIILFYGFLIVESSLKDPTRSYSDEIKNERINLGNISISLADEKYNPDNGLYVLKFKATGNNNSAVVLNNEVLKTRVYMEKGITELKNVNTYFPMNDYFIVEVKELPKDYKALKINFKLNNYDDNNRDNNEGNQYTSADEKIKDYKLLPKTKVEYFVDAYQFRLKEIKQSKSEQEKKITHNTERIDVLKKENQSLNPNDITLSKEDSEKVKSAIDHNKTEIDDLVKQIKDSNQKVKEFEQIENHIESQLESLS